MSNSTIDLYYYSSVLSFAPKLADNLSLLDKDELAVAERLKFPELRQSYIISHGMLRQLLAERVNESAVGLRIEKTEFGKPFLTDYPGLSFNMSHSGDILAIAISNSQCQLGVDVECYKTRNTWEGLVRKCFAPEEAEFWYRQDEMQRAQVFYQFWVKKEAFVKAVGKGITLGLDQCVINPDDLGTFLRVPELAGLAAQWNIHTLDLATQEFGAVVCDKQNIVLQKSVIL